MPSRKPVFTPRFSIKTYPQARNPQGLGEIWLFDSCWVIHIIHKVSHTLIIPTLKITVRKRAVILGH